MSFLALDIGSSSIKGALLDLDQRVVSTTTRRPSPKRLPGPALHFEIKLDEIIAAVRSVIEELLEAENQIEGLISCGQMAGMVLVDPAGNAQSNYLSWQDQRGLEKHPSGTGTYYKVFCERLGSEKLSELGHECKLGSAASLLFWLAENQQLPSHCMPLMLADYVWLKICHAEAITEYTNALGSLNLQTRQWHLEAFRDLGLAEVDWPRLCDPFHAVGELATPTSLIPCYPSVGDHQCALAGTLLQQNELSINASTGSQISLLADSHQPGNYQVRPYFDGQFLNTLTHLPAGRSLNVLVDLLTEIARSQNIELADPWEYIHQVVQTANSDLQTDLAFFAGPMGDRGAISNISVDNLNVSNLFFAAYKNMANNYESCANRLSPARKWNSLVLSGGLAQNSKALRDLVLTRFPGTQRICETTEETFHGLLVLALVASGRAANLATATDLMRTEN